MAAECEHCRQVDGTDDILTGKPVNVGMHVWAPVPEIAANICDACYVLALHRVENPVPSPSSWRPGDRCDECQRAGGDTDAGEFITIAFVTWTVDPQTKHSAYLCRRCCAGKAIEEPKELEDIGDE